MKPAVLPAQWLILRGLLRDTRHWLDFPNNLQKTLGVPVYGLDAPGLGTEAGRDSPTTIDGIRADIRERWLKLKEQNPGPWGIYAVSLGGMITMNWLDEHPEDFACAVIQSTSARDIGTLFERMTFFSATRVIRMPFISDPFEREFAKLQIVTSERMESEARKRIAEAWSKFSLPLAEFRRVAVSQLMAATRYRAPRGPARTPILFMNSLGDRMVNPECTTRIARRLGAPIVTHPWGGHDLALEDTPWICTQIHSWLTRSA